ncbi:MAG: hypothetical protein AB7F25_12400 [Deferribacterales bacterium]
MRVVKVTKETNTINENEMRMETETTDLFSIKCGDISSHIYHSLVLENVSKDGLKKLEDAINEHGRENIRVNGKLLDYIK